MCQPLKRRLQQIRNSFLICFFKRLIPDIIFLPRVAAVLLIVSQLDVRFKMCRGTQRFEAFILDGVKWQVKKQKHVALERLLFMRQFTTPDRPHPHKVAAWRWVCLHPCLCSWKMPRHSEWFIYRCTPDVKLWVSEQLHSDWMSFNSINKLTQNTRRNGDTYWNSESWL